MKSFCNNCSKVGHQSYQCKLPIVSSGVIVFRQNGPHAPREYLMICRKDSLGYVDFIRGKYSVYNKNYILNMMTQMTAAEKNKLRTLTFEGIWHDLWCHNVDITTPEFRRNDEEIAAARRLIPFPKDAAAMKKIEDVYLKERFNLLVSGIYSNNSFYTLNTLLDESERISPAEGGGTNVWTEPEWGFPKGRKNYHEKDLHCALREFEEETGYHMKNLSVLENILPFEEIFTGSNYKSYKHKYYLARMAPATPNQTEITPTFEKGEVSQMKWMTLEECLEKIRPYNVEKKRLICHIDNVLQKYSLV